MIRICPKCDKTFDDKLRRMFPCPDHPETKLATLQSMNVKDVAVPFVTTWNPKPGWLMLTPIILPEKTEAGIVLPESETVKATSGIVVKIGAEEADLGNELFRYMGKEVFFSRHDEYRINDSDSGALLYVLHSSKIILWREPQAQPKFFPISKEKDGVSFPPSLARSMGEEP